MTEISAFYFLALSVDLTFISKEYYDCAVGKLALAFDCVVSDLSSLCPTGKEWELAQE